MIYTIGHEQSYKKAHARYGEVIKVGKCAPCDQFPNGYEGGYAFLSIRDAQRRIAEEYPDRDFAVFGLNATWNDTEPNENGWWHHLLKDAEIIFL